MARELLELRAARKKSAPPPVWRVTRRAILPVADAPVGMAPPAANVGTADATQHCKKEGTGRNPAAMTAKIVKDTSTVYSLNQRGWGWDVEENMKKYDILDEFENER
mmetsp:Transcript_33275/g.67148  ORF Transcript_33275/g.67148 Transcript_33275/m.67148 type:complete len:107 (+) Transcript_33275:383-703(+)